MPKPSAKKAADGAFAPSAIFVIKTNQPAIDKKLAALEKRNEQYFKPEGVTSCKKGGVYFMAGIGVAECTAKGTFDVAGFKLQGTELTKLHGRAITKKTIPDAKVKDAGIRMLMSEKDVTALEKFLKAGKSTITLHDRNASMAKAQIAGALKSWNAFVLADVVCKIYGKDSVKSQHGGFSYGELGEKALELLAGEYAAVKKMKFDDALSAIKEMAGKPSLDQLSGYLSGNSPYDNISPK